MILNDIENLKIDKSILFLTLKIQDFLIRKELCMYFLNYNLMVGIFLLIVKSENTFKNSS